MTYVRTLCYLTLFNPYSYIFNLCEATRYKRYFSNSTTGPPWRIIYFGTDDFSLTCFKPIYAKLRTGTLISDLSVVSQPYSILRKFAEKEGLEVYNYPFAYDNVENKFDLGIIVSFGHLLPKKLINMFPLGILNVHGSLLPRYRGAAPIMYAVKNGDSETGVTIMRIKPHKFDTGDLVRQYRCSIGPDELAVNLTRRLAKHGADLIMECIRDLPRCLEMSTPQPEEGASLAPRVNASLAVLDWATMDSKTIYNLYRAISHVHPLSSYWYNEPVRFYEMSLFKDVISSPTDTKDSSASKKSALDFLNSDNSNKTSCQSTVNETIEPGRVRWNKRTKILRVQCADGNYITCSRLTITGKKLSPTDFYNGYLSKRKENEWKFSSVKTS